ncbi:MAG: transcriptional regulator [uncultured bacterium]|nr:MAG: transcriptional regulator [uncultured bacterium]
MPTKEILPIHRRQISQAIIDRLLSMISDGYWAPGDRLPPQRELAKKFDVGMSTLREGLQSLQTMGILELRHGDGTYLANTPSQEIYSHMVNVSLAMGKMDLLSLFEARGVIETGFSYFAAERASDEQIKDLFDILEQEKNAIEKGQRERTHELDLSFHKKIAEIANNEFLGQIVGSLFEALDEVLRVIPQTTEGWRWHKNVAIAIGEHDPMKASEAMRTLVNASGARLFPFMNNGSKPQTGS